MEFNKYQTPIEDLVFTRVLNGTPVSIAFKNAPKEVQDEFNECIATIPLVQWLISPDRPNIKDLPRDESGKAIWRIEQPPIIEDIDYFRPTAIHFQQTGKFTDLRPNRAPGSEYMKWQNEEVRRIREGYLRESDGAWIPGYMYWYLNYCPILITVGNESSNTGVRTMDFPEFWEGILWRFTGWDIAMRLGLNFGEISKRGASKSYTLASALAKIFIVGTRHDDVRSVGEKANSRGILMAYQKEFLNKSGTLNMFEDMADFIAQNTEFPRKRLKSSLSDMEWTMGYIDLNTGTKRGTGNQVLGIAIKDDPDKGRGKRAELIGFEEFGKFPNVASVIKIAEPSVRDGDLVFGIIVCIGTGGEEGADFSGALDLIYHPSGSHFLSFENVWDKAQQQRGTSIFCFPAYVNRKGCYNKDGISDVTKALYALCFDRYIAKYENPDPFQITRTKAENPITLQDAIMKRDGAYFPVAQLTDRIQEIDLNPNFFDTILVGKFIQKSNGEVSFEPTGETPIHKFPTKDNKISGAVEISKLPEKKDGKVYSGRYIASCDPVDSDEADTMSLVSFFVLDTWTDSIVCEWTGRLSYADDCYELVRLGCIFYNAKLLYENNKKGLYGYFKKMNCLYILAETPEFLKDKDFIRGQKIGNSTYGVNATQPINNYARHLLREWILKPVTVQNTNTDEDEAEVTVTRLMTMWNRAALEEMRQWNENGNYDRVSSLGMLMLIREDRVVTLGDDFGKNNTRNDKDYLGNDPYFSRNYKVRMRQ